MAQFAILTGKALASRIAGFGKVAATFTQATHQLAYSALNHVELHHDAIYCNALFNATPANYRGALVVWFKAFGKVAFDAATKEFTYSKTAKSDMATAITISPADYQKQSSTKDAADFDEIKALESFIKKMVEKGARKRMIHALNGVMRIVKGELPEDKTNVVAAPEVVKARKAKAAGKAAKVAKTEAAPVANAA